MQIKYLDIHSHLDYADYARDFDLVMQNMQNNAVGTITVGTDAESSQRAVVLAMKYSNVWACIGVHPVCDDTESWNEELFEELVKNPKVVAIGECGLDFFRLPQDQNRNIDETKSASIKSKQIELFNKQIQFAIKYKKVLMIHCREAYQETYDILSNYKKANSDLKIHLHFYAGDMEMTQKFLDLGCTFSFTGVITFTRDYDDIIKLIPTDRIMSETDAPFVAPIPYRGRRNEPVYVLEVIKKLSYLKNDNDISSKLLDNAKRVFGIN